MLMTVSVVVFMVGLVSEQVAQLRFDRIETHNVYECDREKQPEK
jgi:hypothetical protein